MSENIVRWIHVELDPEKEPFCTMLAIMQHLATLEGVVNSCNMDTQTLREVINNHPKDEEIVIPCGNAHISGGTVCSEAGNVIGYIDSFIATDCSDRPKECNTCSHKHLECTTATIDHTGVHVHAETFFCDLLRRNFTKKIEEGRA